jgi:uncharacterized protein YqgC (DUF456 family)
MPPLEMAGLTIFILLLFTGIYVAVIGLPGTVLILGSVFLYALLTGFHNIGVGTIVFLVFLTIVAEGIGFTVEFTNKISFGPTLSGIMASLAGSLLGALCLTPLLWGLGTLLGVFLGGFAGFFLTELVRQSKLKPAHRPSARTMLAAAAGIFAKGSCAFVMTVVALLNIYS